ncbi:MAG: YihY/virulence factor BrkB family protein [Acetobacteraceae bacterium]
MEVPPRGWIGTIKGAWRAAGKQNLSLVAGGVTYSIVLALFPGLAALVSIYGLIASPTEVQRHASSLSHLLPGAAQTLITTELHHLVTISGGALRIGTVIGILAAVWSASRGMSNLIIALDIAYGREEQRGFVRFNLVALALTGTMIVGGLVELGLVAGLPIVLSAVGASDVTRTLALVLEWPLLIAIVLTGLAALYRYAPDRAGARWRWLTPGAVVATGLWVIGSVLFSVYVSNFASYDKTYGSLGGIIVLLTWLWLSIYVVLFGAEINAEAERQRRDDATPGEKHA